MKKYKNGLIVGKFSPLHKGHEFLINTALERCEKVFIFSYSNPEFPNCEFQNRRIWLTTLFPNAESFAFSEEFIRKDFKSNLPENDADDTSQRRFVATIWLNLVGAPLDVVFTSEEYGDGFANEMTRCLKSIQVSAVTHELVDLERKTVTISGSKLRQSIHQLKRFVSPIVYASFVNRICFLGAESTGKSTITKILAKDFDTEYVSEYGRDLWEAQGGRLVFDDLMRIARVHIENEERLASTSNRFLFIDTSPLTTLLYSYHLFESADPNLIELSNRKYDLTFLCAPDFPFVQDGTRAGVSFRQKQHEDYLHQLKERKEHFILLEGSLDKRVERVKQVLKSLD